MNDKEMGALFAEILKKMEETNKKLDIFINTLTRYSDLVAEGNEINKNLIKVNANLGSIMAQGLSANADVQLVQGAINFFRKWLVK